MRLMLDGINSDASMIARNFPTAALVAGYVNGRFAWSAADWDLFPHAVHIEISYTASANAGDVLDVELGDATPSQTEAWIRMRKASGYYRPTIYCSLSTVPEVRTGTGPYVLGKDYDLWVADYDDSTKNVYAGAAAKQFWSVADWDLSEVFDDGWPHRKAAPAPKPADSYPAPGNLHVIGGHSSFKATWTKPAVPAGLPQPQYQVYVRHNGKLVASYPRTGITATSYFGGSLQSGQEYVLSVVATGPGGSHFAGSKAATQKFTTG